MKDICVMNASKELKGLYKQHLCCRSDFTVELFKLLCKNNVESVEKNVQ